MNGAVVGPKHLARPNHREMCDKQVEAGYFEWKQARFKIYDSVKSYKNTSGGVLESFRSVHGLGDLSSHRPIETVPTSPTLPPPNDHGEEDPYDSPLLLSRKTRARRIIREPSDSTPSRTSQKYLHSECVHKGQASSSFSKETYAWFYSEFIGFTWNKPSEPVRRAVWPKLPTRPCTMTTQSTMHLLA